MKTPVHILATVRKPELVPAALLTFQTLRTGFPTAPVYVWGNGLKREFVQAVGQAANEAGAHFTNLVPTCHDKWVEHLVMNQTKPLWICDTDVVFFEETERFFDSNDKDLFAGRFEPTWHEPWSQTIYTERLHTALMWFNPSAVRGAMLRWSRQNVPSVFHTAQVPFIRQHFIPGRKGTRLYDTTAGLWQAGWGTKFTERQNAAFEHLHAATYADEIGKCEQLKDLPAVHQAIYANPALARGIQKQVETFHRKHAVKTKGNSYV